MLGGIYNMDAPTSSLLTKSCVSPLAKSLGATTKFPFSHNLPLFPLDSGGVSGTADPGASALQSPTCAFG